MTNTSIIDKNFLINYQNKYADMHTTIFCILYLFSYLHLVPNQRLENLFPIFFFLSRQINRQQQAEKYDESGVRAILWRETNENDRKEIGIFCHMKFRFVQKNNFEIQSNNTCIWLILHRLNCLRYCNRFPAFDTMRRARALKSLRHYIIYGNSL